MKKYVAFALLLLLIVPFPAHAQLLSQIPWSVGYGGTGVSTLAANGVLYGNGTGVVLVTAQGAANSILIANAGAPSFTATPTIGGPVQLGTTALQSTALIGARANGNGYEFGHTNAAGYGSTLGAESGTGRPFLCFNCEHGTNASSYRTRGIAGVIVETDAAGSLLIGSATAINADNQAFTQNMSIGTAGAVIMNSTLSVTTSVTSPLIIGGTAAGSSLTLESTSGAGTTDSIIFKTASQTTRMTLLTGGQLQIGTTAPQSTALVSARAAGNGIEFGHTNGAGFGSALGSSAGNGRPFLCFDCEAGSTNNTFRTRGIAGVVIETDGAGALLIGAATTASADNQSFTQYASMSAAGNFGLGVAPSSTARFFTNYANTDPVGSVANISSSPTTTLTANNAQVTQGEVSNAIIAQGGFNATAQFGARGGDFQGTASGATGTVTGAIGVRGAAVNSGAGTLTGGWGFVATGANSGGGTFTTFTGYDIPAATFGATMYGYRSQLASNANRWNFYSDGTAVNYFAGNVGIGQTVPIAGLDASLPAATTGTVIPNIAMVGAAHTSLTASTERFDSNFNSARTVQWATGALATQRFNLFQAPTLGFVGASTVTDTCTLCVTGAPISGANATLSSTHGLLIQAGAVTAGTNAFGATINAPTGATTNYAAQFVGENLHSAVLFANLGTPANGAFVYCSNCDAPTLVDQTCTSSGGQTGSFAARVNNLWKCFT